jgi:hypothetical protein
MQAKQSKPGFSDENAAWLKPKFTEHAFGFSSGDEDSEEELPAGPAKRKNIAVGALLLPLMLC